MRVLVYEFVTGGGMWSVGQQPSGSLLAEGRAMAGALCEDFAALGAEVTTLVDARLSGPVIGGAMRISSVAEERDALARLAKAADWTIVIAPETAGSLLERCQWVQQAGGRLLSPASATIELASSKQRTAAHLAKRGIAVPRGLQIGEGFDAANLQAGWFPAVLKPLDGCGSEDVRLVRSREELRAIGARHAWRLEQYVPGLAASVAVLCGPSRAIALPACEQRLSHDGRFTYLGGRTPLKTPLDKRARRLALAAVASLPDPLGYIGVDLVLGDDANGRADHVIEINPRLTTSYVGLRALCRENLAAAMLAAAEGREPALSWHERVVEFSAGGAVRVPPRQCPQPSQPHCFDR